MVAGGGLGEVAVVGEGSASSAAALLAVGSVTTLFGSVAADLLGARLCPCVGT